MTAMFMVSSMISGPEVPGHSELVSAIFEIFIRVRRRGRMTGKLRIAIREKLLLARDAIAATMVRMEDKPKLPRINVSRNSSILTTWFPISNRNIPKERSARIVNRSRL